jgi:hypothetical protein
MEIKTVFVCKFSLIVLDLSTDYLFYANIRKSITPTEAR